MYHITINVSVLLHIIMNTEEDQKPLNTPTNKHKLINKSKKNSIPLEGASLILDFVSTFDEAILVKSQLTMYWKSVCTQTDGQTDRYLCHVCYQIIGL